MLPAGVGIGTGAGLSEPAALVTGANVPMPAAGSAAVVPLLTMPAPAVVTNPGTLPVSAAC